MATDDATDHPVPPGGTLLGVWAHPDDESYLAAGLMARTVAAGGLVVSVFATRGEAGTDDPRSWPPPRLARLRELEARRALAVVGAEPPRFLDHRDGSCALADPSRAAARIESVIDAVQPDAIVTFGGDGITGHDDHRAVSAWTVAAWQSVRRRRLHAPPLLMPALSSDFVTRHARWHEEIGLFGPDGPRVTTEADIVVRIALSPHELDQKQAMLAAHASQTDQLAAQLGPESYRHWWDVENFRRPDAAELAGASVDQAA